MKRCSKCGETKDESEFYLNKSTRRISSWCKSCVIIYNQQPKIKARRKIYGQTSERKTKQKENVLRWKENNPKEYEFYIIRNSLKRHGSRPPDVELAEFLSKRPPVCEICGKPPNGKALAVDHDHKTNQLRGFLCEKCNRHLLGMFGDPSLLRRAADYLETTWQERLKK